MPYRGSYVAEAMFIAVKVVFGRYDQKLGMLFIECPSIGKGNSLGGIHVPGPSLINIFDIGFKGWLVALAS